MSLSSSCFNLTTNAVINGTIRLMCSIKSNVDAEASISFSVLSLLSFVLLTILLIYYYHGDEKTFGTTVNTGLLFFSTIVTSLSEISYDDSQDTPYSIATTIVVVVFGIGVTCCAQFFFFEVSRSTEIRSIGYGHENIAGFIWVITNVIIPLELCLLFGSIYDKNYISTILILSGLIQKPAQAWMYKFSLQYRVLIKGKYIGASWYLKIIALFNFAMWLESIMIADEQGNKYMKGVLKESYTIFSSAYAALLIDYRLLCCILFIEQALDIDRLVYKSNLKKIGTARSDTPRYIVEHASTEIAELYKYKTIILNGCAYVVGVTLLGLQVINALQYDRLGPWTNIFGIATDIAIIICGMVLLVQVKGVIKSKRANLDLLTFGADVLMIGMGIFGMLYWYLKGTITIVWAARTTTVGDTKRSEYLYWNGIKYCCKPFAIAFQIYLFMNTNSKLVCQKVIVERKRNHFIVPVLMFSFLSVFLNAVIDSYDGIIENLARDAEMDTVFLTLYRCGPPIHLGFCLHLFLHYYRIGGKFEIYRKAACGRNNISSCTANNEDGNITQNKRGNAQNDEENRQHDGGKDQHDADVKRCHGDLDYDTEDDKLTPLLQNESR